MNQRRITRGATGAVITVLALGALQGASAAGTGGGSGPAEVSVLKPPEVCVGAQAEGSLSGQRAEDGYPHDTPLYRTLTYIEEKARAHRGIFTGVAVDEGNGTADVYRIPGEGAERFDADVCGAAEKGVTVRLYDTEATERELEDLVDRISGDMERWEGTFSIFSVGMDAHTVIVGVSDSAKAGPILREAYGEETMRHLRIEEEEQAGLLPEAR